MARLSCADCGCDPTLNFIQCKKKCDCNSHDKKFDIYLYDGRKIKDEIE